MANITTEDFTFPTFSDIFSFSAIDSPPLWHLSPEHHHAIHTQTYDNEESDDDQEEDYKDCFATIPILELPCEEKLVNSENEDDEGEKMDMLWEDFNEELLLKSYSSRVEMVNMGCIQALRMSSNKTSGAVVAPPRKPSAGFLVLMKVLRKLFLIHHTSRRSVKNHNSRSPVKRT